MARHEIYGKRDLSYSKWHREIPDDDLTMIDIDCLEYCRNCGYGLALIELAQDNGQDFKNTKVTRFFADRAKVPAYLVFYSIPNAGKPRFRVSRVTHPHEPEQILNEECYIAFLKKIHADCPCRQNHAA